MMQVPASPKPSRIRVLDGLETCQTFHSTYAPFEKMPLAYTSTFVAQPLGERFCTEMSSSHDFFNAKTVADIEIFSTN